MQAQVAASHRFVAIGNHLVERLFPGLLVHDFHCRRERHDFVIVSPGRLRFRRALLAEQGELVLALAADIVAIGDDLGSLDHRHPERGHALEKFFFSRVVHVGRAAELHEGDGLDAAGRHDRHALVQNASGGHGNRLQSR